jgi:hypothetical protein
MARGIHPAILANGGLRPALRTLARRSPIPVDLEVRAEGRLPEQVEVSAYYVVAEALTNAVKHARASAVSVEAEVAGQALRVAVRAHRRTSASRSLAYSDRVAVRPAVRTVHIRHDCGSRHNEATILDPSSRSFRFAKVEVVRAARRARNLGGKPNRVLACCYLLPKGKLPGR